MTVMPTTEPQIKVSFGVSQQQGFKYSMYSANGIAKLKQPLHLKNEDFYFPVLPSSSTSSSDSSSNSSSSSGHDNDAAQDYDAMDQEPDHYRYTSQNTSKYGDIFFLMADGHAGHEAPAFFIDRISVAIMDILNLKLWDFGDQESNAILTRRIALVYSELDDEYTRIKTREYQTWNQQGASPSTRPCDDGCTMILNIISTTSGYLLNCNVGDSRTVLAKREVFDEDNGSQTIPILPERQLRQDQDSEGDDDTFSNEYDHDDHDDEMEIHTSSPPLSPTGPQWETIFASIDHDMTNPHKVYSIHRNGGKFLDATGTTFLHPRVEEPYKRMAKGYPELVSSRLFRPMSDVVRVVGCSHRRTLNLSGTLGDLLFKIHPPVLVSTPDFTFIKLQPGMEHLLVVATDGIWDHLSTNDFMRQNQMVMDKVTDLLESDHSSDEYMDSSCLASSHGSSSTSSSETTISSLPPSTRGKGKSVKVTPQVLKKVCKKLVDREPVIDKDGMDLLYSRNLMRYDDATIMIIHIA